MTGNWESHLAVTCTAAACAVKVQGLDGADEVEPGTKPSPYLPLVPLDGPRHPIFLHAFMPNGRTTSSVGAVRCCEQALRKLQAYVDLAETGSEYLS